MTKLKITAQGNGWPSNGDRVFDSSSDSIYVITNDSATIHTDGGRGNYCYMEGDYDGESGDLTEAEWLAVHDCKVET